LRKKRVKNVFPRPNNLKKWTKSECFASPTKKKNRKTKEKGWRLGEKLVTLRTESHTDTPQ